MNLLTKWTPFPEMPAINDRFESLFGKPIFNSFSPAVNVSETQTHYKIKAELPGLKKEDVKVSFENGVLTVSGERKEEHEDKSARYHVYECTSGSFSRSFGLGNSVDPQKIDAEFKDGVLSVTLAKSESAKNKEIEIISR